MHGKEPVLPQLEPLSANRLDTLRHDFDANKSNRMAMNLSLIHI